jgi:peptidoglycan/LPS O-acetylase OafA/YrhL
VTVFVFAGIAATIPLAYASWFLVEKPAKSFVGRIARRTRAQPVRAVT